MCTEDERQKLAAIGVPTALHGAVVEATARFAGDPFELREGLVCARSASVVRAVAVRSVLTLEAAAAAPPPWTRALPVDARNSGIGADGFALCDEITERVRHCGSRPTHHFAVFCPSSGEPHVIAWPTDAARTAEGDEVTRDYIAHRYMLDSPLHRAVQLIPWLSRPRVWACTDERRAVRDTLRAWRSNATQRSHAAARAASEASTAAGRLPPSASGRQVFLGWLASRGVETAQETRARGGEAAPRRVTPRPLHVYTDLPQVRANLTSDRFALADARDAADIWWLGDHLSADDFATLLRRRSANNAEKSPMVNQFAHESCVTSKNLLAECAAAKYGHELPWLPESYTLPQELPEMARAWGEGEGEGEGEEEEAGEEDGCAARGAPTFLLKPWASSRSRGLVATSESACALALCCRPAAPLLPTCHGIVPTRPCPHRTLGPRLASRYVDRPFLVDGRKWDARVYVAVYDETESNSQTIWGAEELARRVDAACGRPGTWSSSVWPSIRTVISDTFALLVDRAQTDSPLSSGGCRALYGVDVMLAEDAHWRSPRGEADGRTPQPVLLEVNYSPDLTSVLRLYPRFVDGLFERLFDEVGPRPAPRGDDERERAHASWEEL